MNSDSSQRNQPILAITLGDPAGVGPELCLKAFNSPELHQLACPVLIGDSRVLAQAASALGVPFNSEIVIQDPGPSLDLRSIQGPTMLHIPELDLKAFQPGKFSSNTGSASFAYIQRAIDLAIAGQVAGVVTGPIQKEALFQAGLKYPGHTEIFAERCGLSTRWCMMQYSDPVTCSFVTTHIGYAEVPAALSVERILEVIELTHEALIKIREHSPKLAVLGLNPHAGERGLFGEREEERVVIPAIEMARSKGISVEGPLPPDTAFTPLKRKLIDGFVCLYHDQGHIPVKALAFDQAVNTTLGLPIIRTSVDHGTAMDIAWKGIADSGSLFAAYRLAAKLAKC